MKYYAIRDGLYAELRSSKERLKRVTSTLTRKAVDVTTYNPETGSYKTTKKKVTYKQVSYLGGKVMGTCSYAYALAGGIRIVDKGIAEIDKHTMERLLRYPVW